MKLPLLATLAATALLLGAAPARAAVLQTVIVAPVTTSGTVYLPIFWPGDPVRLLR